MQFHYLILYREPGFSYWRWLSTIKCLDSRTKEVAKFTSNGSVIKSYFSKKIAEQVRAGLVEFERRRQQGITYRNSRTKEVTKFTMNGSVIKSYSSKKIDKQDRAGLVEFERRRLQGTITRRKSPERQEIVFLDFTLAEYEALLEGVDSFFTILEEEWQK